MKNIGPRPGLGNKKPGEKRPREDEDDDPKSKFLTSDYVVPPKVPQLQLGPGEFLITYTPNPPKTLNDLKS